MALDALCIRSNAIPVSIGSPISLIAAFEHDPDPYQFLDIIGRLILYVSLQFFFDEY